MEGKNNIREGKEGDRRWHTENVSFYNNLLETYNPPDAVDAGLSDKITHEMALYFDGLEKSGILERIISRVQKLVDRSGA